MSDQPIGKLTPEQKQRFTELAKRADDVLLHPMELMARDLDFIAYGMGVDKSRYIRDAVEAAIARERAESGAPAEINAVSEVVPFLLDFAAFVQDHGIGRGDIGDEGNLRYCADVVSNLLAPPPETPGSRYVLGVDECPHDGDHAAYVILERATGKEVASGFIAAQRGGEGRDA